MKIKTFFKKNEKLVLANICMLILLVQVIYFFVLIPYLKNNKNNNEIKLEHIIKTNTVEKNKSNSLSLNSVNIVDSIFNQLTIDEKAAQLIMVGTSEKYGIGLPYPTVKKLVKNNIVGSVLFLKGNSEHFKLQRIELDSTNKSKVKQMYACDCEPSLFHKKFIDVDSVFPTSYLTDTFLVNKVVSTINAKMNDMGLQINFAPVADVAINQEIINNRSFGNNPQMIEILSKQFIEKSKQQKVFCAIKHFPGHGAVIGDTHKEKVFIDGDLTEIETFKTIINTAQPAFVMIGHMSIENNVTYTTKGKPCSISKNIVTDLLKTKIGYNGIVITDAMNMKAVKNYANADWQAILAGNDIVLMPNDAPKLHAQIVANLKLNNILSKQLETSIKKVLKLKLATKN